MAVVMLFGWLFLVPTSMGGQTSYVTTHGTSMAPRFHAGDLAIVRATGDYQVGDVVAYHSHLLKTTVMHRIIARDGAAFVFKGDNNDFIDPEHPAGADLIGRLAVRVPQGGVWLARLSSPAMLGLFAFGLLAGGGTVAQTRRRKKKRHMSQHAQRVHPALTLGSLSPNLSTAAMFAALLGVLGVGLGVVAWTGPPVIVATNTTPSDQSVRFSYTAQVPRSAAYDNTTVHSPDPVFRALAQSVDVSYRYHGEPGTVAVTADLSAASGWHSTLPLSGATRFDTHDYNGTVSLDLRALQSRAQRAATVIGVPVDQLTVTVRPRFVTDSGAVFAPQLPLNLSATHLALSDPSALRVADTGTAPKTTGAPRTLGLGGHEISVATARMLTVALLGLALLLAALVAALARLGTPTSEGAAIRQRHANLLVRVEPMPAPSGRPVIDVTQFPTLAKLAERYGLLVLHWSRSDIETFIVQDESTTYRYRTSPSPRSGDCEDFADRTEMSDGVEAER